MPEPASTPGPDLPGTFILELTRRCNNRCMYCYTAWGAARLGYGRHDHHEMSLADIQDMIARLQDEVDLKVLGLSGGEPLLREDLTELMGFISARGIAPFLITNGSLLTADLAGRLAAYQPA
jgi:MoaA/NifB/PqqE/SkfB family radical SAM enzyme